MDLDPELLAILACPACHAELVILADELACAGCGLHYPIRDGIPVLLADEARPAQAGS